MKSLRPSSSPGSSSSGMTRSHLIETLARKLAVSRGLAEAVVSTVFEALARTLKNGSRVEIRGLGAFWVREYGGYVGRNPRTGAAIEVPPKRLRFQARQAGDGAH
jgi:integration host factor subunit beta